MSDRLTLTREIARSGIATVWEGFDTGLDRKVLVKAIHPQFARDPDLRTRFEREARAIARISHPNVVQIYDLQIQDDRLRLILEFVEGGTLGQAIKRVGRFAPEVAVSIACNILEGLKQAHAEAIIHRDLKPDNILLTKGGQAKITDFGLATLKDQPTVTQEGMVIGTPSYMAPEQALGTAVSERTDLFTTGLILFEMLTGKRLIEGESMGEAFQNVINYRPPDLTQYAEYIPPGVMPTLQSLLEREPEKRYADAVEVHEVLRKSSKVGVLPPEIVGEYLAGKPLDTSDLELAAELAEDDSEAGSADARPGKHRLWWLIAVMVAILGISLWQFGLSPEPELVETPDDTTAVPIDTTITPEDTSQAAQDSLLDTTSTDIGSTIIVPPTPREPEPEDTVSEGGSSIEIEQGATGLVRLTCRPWARVFVGDSAIGTTPLPGSLELTAGSHTLVLMNDEIGYPVTRQVNVLPDRTIELDVALYDFVARIRAASVRPWADVYVDEELEFRTPSSKIIFRPLGRHVITLRHPNFEDYIEEVVFEQGDPVYEIRVNLAQL